MNLKSKMVLLLHCAESGKKALDKITQLGLTLPEDVSISELPCSGRVNEALLMEALEDGFDGVMVIACHKENCKYLDGNLRSEKRVARVKNLLADAGIDNKYVDMTFIAPDEGRKLLMKIQDFCEKVTN